MYKSKRVLTFIIIINLLLKYPNGVKVSYTFYISLRKSRVGTVIIVIYAKKIKSTYNPHHHSISMRNDGLPFSTPFKLGIRKTNID